MGIYATEDIWHGQEVMLVNQEQPSDPDDTSRKSTAEATELNQEGVEEGNPQESGAGMDDSREPSHTGDPIVYSPIESG